VSERPQVRWRQGRIGGGFNPGPEELIVRSGEQVVLYYAYGAIPDVLPEGFSAERDRVLCLQPARWLCGGNVHAVRVAVDGESALLAPGQASSLGAYDAHLWLALYPEEGALKLRAIDCPSALFELVFVLRHPLVAHL